MPSDVFSRFFCEGKVFFFLSEFSAKEQTFLLTAGAFIDIEWAFFSSFFSGVGAVKY